MELEALKDKIRDMSELSYSMLERTYQGFRKHDMDILREVLKDEDKLNKMERDIDTFIAGASKSGKLTSHDKDTLMRLSLIGGDLEAVGDYCKDMIERIEIKIQEKLLFSDEAVAEYKHLYEAVRNALGQVVNALKMNDNKFVSSLVCAEDHAGVDKLLAKYQESHARRLVQGLCSPLACNMFANLLEFTAAIYTHAKNIAVTLKKIE